MRKNKPNQPNPHKPSRFLEVLDLSLCKLLELENSHISSNVSVKKNNVRLVEGI